jgi:small subunit ribosomal protein S1
MVLDVDLSKRRISLGLKQCISNPWTEFTDKFKAGDKVEGEIKNITEFGLFVGLTEEIDGMVHLSDLDWVKPGEDVIDDYKKGDTLKVKILEVDLQKERISLGVKQLIDDPVTGSLNKIKKGDVVTCTITKVVDNGIEVNIMGDLPGFIRRNDLSRDRSEQRPDRFAAGEVVDAKVSTIDKAGRKVSLSIKAREVEEENRAMAEFGSSNAGASLGDILGAALKEKSAQAGDNDESERENTGDLLDVVTPKDAVEELVMNDTAKTDKTVNDKVVEKSKKVSTKKQKAVKKTASTKKKTAAKKKATTKKNSTPTSASDS